MAKKLKISREYTFKAYSIDKEQEFKNNIHCGEFLFKSECHYYCEKFVLDFLNNNTEDNHVYLIYKISTLEDTNVDDMLIEQIQIIDGIINIK